jgi:ABC-type iron transport system FetAB permease component
MDNFYTGLQRNQNRYVSSLSFGEQHEALVPTWSWACITSLKMGDLSTIGIVHLPGMMAE